MRYVIGIDEVGRGPLAGPVVVCAVALISGGKSIKHKVGRTNLRDSKRLSAKQREEWFAHIRKHPKIRFAIAKVYPKMIDRINISRAANSAAMRALQRLIANRKLRIADVDVFLDGGLYVGNSKSRRKSAYGLRGSAPRTIVRGDEKIPAISLASIIAKVTRDRLMTRMAKQYPRYGFEAHKGYGTVGHRKAIRKFGPSPIHRLTFL
jgi:ribonuclease HII